jgi:DnaJ-class molecular chaperone
MERKTHYMVLGVSRTESPTGIRARYRDLARKLHPDVAGEEATRAFQELNEAFTVLSDPERRRAYNRELSRTEEDEAVSFLHMRRQPRPIVRNPLTILGNRESVFPSFEALYERFLRNFTGRRVPKSERLEGLDFEVLLTREEVSRGCVVPVGIPVFRRCSRCGGSGRYWASWCSYCGQQGMIETEEVVRVRIPPHVPSGTVFEIPLRGLGIYNLCLRIHVFVEADQRDAHGSR